MRLPYIAVLALLGACGGGPPRPTALVATGPVAHLDSTAWRDDVRFLASEMAARHANAFFKTSRAAFENEAARIDSAIPHLDDAAVVYRMKRLVAMIGDGHTGGPMFMPAERRLPLRFEWFSNGIALVAAGSAYTPLIGRRLVRVGAFDAAAVFDTLAQYDAADNVWGQRSRAPRYLSSATALAAVGLVRVGDPISMTLGDTTVSIPWPAPSAATPQIATAARPALPFSWRYVADRGAVVIRYDLCNFGREFALMTDTILRFIDSAKVRRVVVDVRANPGGSTRVAQPLIAGLLQRAKTMPGSGIYVLMGRNTYSSAMDFAIEMRNRVHAVLAGEATGGTPNGYGEVKQVVLPSSRLSFQYSTKYFGLDPRGGNTVEPDLSIPTTIEAFVARRDVVLETVLAR